MNQEILGQIAAAYGWEDPVVEPVATGLINNSWKLMVGPQTFLLQRVNTAVFRHPSQIDANLRMLAEYLSANAPGYLFTAPVLNEHGEGLMEIDKKCYRVFPFIPGSHTIDVVEDPAQAFAGAEQFGKFTAVLDGFDARRLRITLPDFHNLQLRAVQFDSAVKDGIPERLAESGDLTRYLQSMSGIVDRYRSFLAGKDVRVRVTHHDTKISNVLLDEDGKGLCVIDLDTVMPGYFLSDVGDMFRTYVCPVSEEEKDLDKIVVRPAYLDAVRQGYLEGMAGSLTNFELDHFHFAGTMLIYMQAIRFLTDYLTGDKYYGSRYPGQNLVRAKNQGRLLEVFQEAE